MRQLVSIVLCSLCSLSVANAQERVLTFARRSASDELRVHVFVRPLGTTSRCDYLQLVRYREPPHPWEHIAENQWEVTVPASSEIQIYYYGASDLFPLTTIDPTNVVELDFWYVNAELGVGWDPLTRFTDAQVLHTHRMIISDAIIERVMQLPRLRVVDFGRGAFDVTDEGARLLSTLYSLEILNLRFSRIGEEGLRHLSRLPRLRYLTLGDTALTDSEIDPLGHMVTLKALELPSGVSGTRIDLLRRLLPDTRIWGESITGWCLRP